MLVRLFTLRIRATAQQHALVVAEKACNRLPHFLQFADHPGGRKISNGVAKEVEDSRAKVSEMADGCTKGNGVAVRVRKDPDHR